MENMKNFLVGFVVILPVITGSYFAPNVVVAAMGVIAVVFFYTSGV